MNVLLFISGSEIFIIILVVLLLFGAKKIPEIARMLGKGMNEFRKATDEIKREVEEKDPGGIADVAKNVRKFKREIDNNLKG